MPWRDSPLNRILYLTETSLSGPRRRLGRASHRRCPALDLLGVAEVPPRRGPERSIELVYARHAGGNVQVHDLLVGQSVQVLDQSAKAVAVGRHKDAFMA